MAYRYAKLKGRIVEKFETQGKFAKALGVVPLTVSRKLNGEVGFTRDEMLIWAELLGIKKSEIISYFFN